MNTGIAGAPASIRKRRSKTGEYRGFRGSVRKYYVCVAFSCVTTTQSIEPIETCHFGTKFAAPPQPARDQPLVKLLGEAALKIFRSCLMGLAVAGMFTANAAMAGVAVSDQMTLYNPDHQPIYQVTLYEDGSSLYGFSGTPSTVSYCSEGIFTPDNYCVFPLNIGNSSLALNGGESPTALFISEGANNNLSDFVFVYDVVVGKDPAGNNVTQPWVLFESDAEGQNIPWGPNVPVGYPYTWIHEAGIGLVDVTSFLRPDLIDSGYTLTFQSDVPEPLTLSLFGAGLAGAVAMRRRRKTTG